MVYDSEFVDGLEDFSPEIIVYLFVVWVVGVVGVEGVAVDRERDEECVYLIGVKDVGGVVDVAGVGYSD